jgi:hypothetical protein
MTWKWWTSMERLHARQATDFGPFLYSRAKLFCPVCDCDHGGAAGNRPWLDLMGRGKEVEEGLDLSVGELIREMEVR